MSCAGVVAVDEGGAVLVVDDEVEVAVVIEVAIGGAVGEGRLGEAPGFADILELKVAEVAIGLVSRG